jgi:hypothetical protein
MYIFTIHVRPWACAGTAPDHIIVGVAFDIVTAFASAVPVYDLIAI